VVQRQGCEITPRLLGFFNAFLFAIVIWIVTRVAQLRAIFVSKTTAEALDLLQQISVAQRRIGKPSGKLEFILAEHGAQTRQSQ
jgi:hypothetical protein